MQSNEYSLTDVTNSQSNLIVTVDNRVRSFKFYAKFNQDTIDFIRMEDSSKFKSINGKSSDDLKKFLNNISVLDLCDEFLRGL